MALIPAQNDDVVYEAEEENSPTLTWRVNVDNEDGMDGSISGETENLEAIKQKIYLMLNIQRNKFIIYKDTGYGIELEDLIGMPIPYVVPEIDRRYREALLRIPEVIGVGNFAFSIPEGRKDILIVKFTVSTIYGEYTTENGVAL